ncbi:SpoIIE family protein phosphatase [Streptomyces sp. CC77]|uniref:SpoIIE family protein phosphatase n=1 Tax=Streptomyces sp. CC77 TaxID=1906739 RepID=UPI0009A0D9AF|nr:SpoIIE family protein phosphatase [Streptomyces sp. CC77]
MDEPMTTFNESPEDPFSVRHAASAVLDGRGRVVGWSEQAHALLGYPAQEALGRSSVGFLVDPADYDVVMEAVSVCVRDAGWFGIVPVRRRDGGRVDLGCRVRPITRDGDPPCEWFLVGAPAAEVVQWETDRSVLDGLFRRSPIGLSVHATDLSILRVNRAVANFSRIPVEQHRGQRIGLYVVPQDTETVERQLREVLETGRSSISTEQPCRLAHDPTRELVVSVSAFRMEDPAGRVLGVTQTIEDVTERYRARYRLALLNEAGARIGTTLDVARTARELAEVAAPGLADCASVDLLEQVVRGEEPGRRLPAALHRAAVRCTPPDPPGGPGAMYPAGHRVPVPPDSPQAWCLAERRPFLDTRPHGTGAPDGPGRPEGTTGAPGATAGTGGAPGRPVDAGTGVRAGSRDATGTDGAEGRPGATRWRSTAARDGTDRRGATTRGGTPPAAGGPAQGEAAAGRRAAPGAAARTAPAVAGGPGEGTASAGGAPDPSATEPALDPATPTLMVVPLVARGLVLGLLSLWRSRRLEPFEKDDVKVAEEFASRAAVCIDNARRYTQQHDAALTLQHSLLPHDVPRHPAVEVAHRYLPADAASGGGGDWGDVIPLAGLRVALVVGDVVGHGIHAAATMGRLRTAVHTLAHLDLTPDEVLSHLDDLVDRLAAEQEPAGGAEPGGAPSPQVVGATCLYAVYDPVSRHCALARAGHPPPAVVEPDGAVRFLDLPAGPPLGLGGLPFESAELTLAEGSVLALYTDGLVHARTRDVDESLEDLRGALAGAARPLEEVCAGVEDRLLHDHATDEVADDAALLLSRTRVLPAEQVATWQLPMADTAPADARSLTASQLARWDLADMAFTTELIVSELVTNAFRYGEGPITLRLIRDRVLICEVSDTSSTAPHLRRARSTDEGGRGLFLIAQLTERWGTRYGRDGKTIWTEQPLSAAASPGTTPWPAP